MIRSISIISFFLIVSFFLSPNKLKAQDPSFTQFISLPLALNPAFTGATPSYRLVTGYKKEQIKIPKAFETNILSFDYNLFNIKSGIGLQIIMDRSSALGYTSTSALSSYSYVFQLRNGYVVRSGIQMGFIMQNRNLANIRFVDDRERLTNTNRNFFDFSTGTIVHNEKYWFGIALYHLNQKFNDLTAKEFQQEMKISIHGGAKFLLKGFVKENTFVAASYLYEKQGNASRLVGGLNYSNKPLILGVWLKRESWNVSNNNTSNISAGFLSGLRLGDFSFRYNFDLPISGKTDIGGSHEITINITPLRYKHSSKMIQCPMF